MIVILTLVACYVGVGMATALLYLLVGRDSNYSYRWWVLIAVVLLWPKLWQMIFRGIRMANARKNAPWPPPMYHVSIFAPPTAGDERGEVY